ncbi:HAMP domain-containing sensor histidine kinase [Hyphomicrobium sp.]|uniref:sensor histidine kinase n=1 Tax=Hyphomicrobium sp. TaxID=82 RepID=UPI001DBF4877|nr:HAMP domain-containing sensor histidine kinase [Hyphomicrobium sp.]MBY0562472.1 HAMP domain-containing histidine kinase [Hyphomicrobium sp.]
MAVSAKPAMPVQRDELAPLDAAPATQAVITIDPEAAEILGATPSGAAALGLFPYASFPIALDPATPAVAKLRQIAPQVALQGDYRKGDVETLVFWNSGLLKRLKCRVTRQGKKGSKVLLLHVVDEAEAPDPEQKIPGVASSGSRNLAPLYAAVTAEIDALRAAEAAAVEAAPQPLIVMDADHLAKLAHELKTPLTAIAAASEIMRDERLGEMKNERYLSYAADIHESATHALDVITSLLLNRDRSSSMPVARLIALDLNALVERTVSSVQALAQSCGLTLDFKSDGSRPHVVANPTALRQILLNLLTNAIKFTPRGGDVRVETGHIGDGRVFLVVSDTGRGMNGTRSAAYKASAAELQPPWAASTGIGLPLVARLVREMGAEFEIESIPEGGTAALIVFGDFSRRME